MTPEEAREIDRLEYEADCRAARERAYALIAERRTTERKRLSRLNSYKRSDLLEAPKPVPIIKPRPRLPHGGPAQKRTAFGMSLTLQEWADHLGIGLNTLHQRMHKRGSLEDAIAVGGPKSPHRPKVEPGVAKNFPALEGTGGGSTAQDIV